jgi:hypothetical protein
MKKYIISFAIGVVLFAISTICVIDFPDKIETFLACLPLYIIGTILVYKSIAYFLR